MPGHKGHQWPFKSEQKGCNLEYDICYEIKFKGEVLRMTDKDREKWDQRYQKDFGDLKPSLLLEQYVSSARLGKALDIACGNGRNSVFLAEKGFQVEAVDISTRAMERVKTLHSRITAMCLDLDSWVIPENEYDLIVNIRFLDRRLFPMITLGLKPGGMLMFESFAGGEDDRFCLKKNELLHAFSALDIVFYEEKKLEDGVRFKGMASLVGVKSGDEPRH